MQMALAASGLVGLTCVVVFLPETSHPGSRGVDKLAYDLLGTRRPTRWKLEFINPFGALWLLRSPVLMAVVSLSRDKRTSCVS